MLFIVLVVFIIGVLSFSSYAWYTPTPTRVVGPTPTPVIDAPTLDPNTIPKFVNQLEKPFVYVPTLIKDCYGKVIRQEYTVSWAQTFQQILPPGFPQTRVTAFGGLERDPNNPNATPVFRRSVPGATFELTRGLPVINHWRNEVNQPQFLAVDPTLDWANPNNFPPPCPPFLPFPPGYPQAQFPVPDVIHTHGIEVVPRQDGTPDEWFTFNGITGPNFETRDYMWPVSNESSAFWYHDHAFGITRLNVYSGLSGFWIERDPKNPLDQPTSPLPTGKYEMPMILQDKSFNKDGSLWYPRTGDVPDLHPYWRLMFDGQVNVVNGKVWPNMNVEPRQYRFRLLNAADQRFYRLSLSNGMPFTIIGTDGGYRETPAVVTSFRIGVTERYDFLIDFSTVPVGTKIIMQNTEQLQPPIGPPPDPNTDGIVMQFTVVNAPRVTPRPLPAKLNTIARLTPNAPPRVVVQNVQTNAAGQIITAMLDGRLFHQPIQEYPQVGSTEIWQFTNITPLEHVKHVHLIQFQVLNRQPFDATAYMNDWFALNGPPPFEHPTIRLAVEPYLTGPPVPPDPEDTIAWKDSVRVPAGMITRIIVRWAPQFLPTGAGTPGVNQFPFNPFGNGYVWHCHLLEHEDNEMIQQLQVVPYTNYPDWMVGTFYPAGSKVRFGEKQYQAIVSNTASLANRPDISPFIWKVITFQPSLTTTPFPTCPVTSGGAPPPTRIKYFLCLGVLV
jgi:FtsP/CotA-like multicopper oxidase with cupredoxin domain